MILSEQEQQHQQHQQHQQQQQQRQQQYEHQGQHQPPRQDQQHRNHRRLSAIELGNRFCTRLLKTFSNFTPSEISGAAGDLGTLIPLLTATAHARSIHLAPTLFLNGLSNIALGLIWNVPVCVQPMKSIAAVALSEGLSAESVTAAGILVGFFLTVVGATGLIEAVNLLVPTAVVSGLQVGIGLKLMVRGIQMIGNLGWLSWVPETRHRTVVYGDCIALAVACAIFSLVLFRDSDTKRMSNEPSPADHTAVVFVGVTEAEKDGVDDEQNVKRNENDNDVVSEAESPPDGERQRQPLPRPVGLYLFFIGTTFAIVTLYLSDNANGQFDLPLRFFGAPVAILATKTITPADWKVGFLEGAVPQIPLTILNSVISVCSLAHDLYPQKRRPRQGSTSHDVITTTDAVISRKAMSVCVGLMNLVACSFGAMPSCCGAGGLAGQHRYGARSGSSVVFLGCCKIAIAVFLGASALTLLDAIPLAVLGVMLASAGQELATTGVLMIKRSKEKEEEEGGEKGEVKKNLLIVIVTASIIVSNMGGTHVAALCGLVAYVIYGAGYDRLMGWIRRKWRRASSGT